MDPSWPDSSGTILPSRPVVPRATGAARHSLYGCSGSPLPIERLTVEFPGDPEHLIFNGPKVRRCGETVTVDQRIGPNARVRPDYLRGLPVPRSAPPDCAFRAEPLRTDQSADCSSL